MKLVITVEQVKGRCPVYRKGNKIVLDRGYSVNMSETDCICIHSLSAIMPFYVALAKGIPPGNMGLAGKENDDGKAYVHCPDVCEITGGGTVIFSIERVE